MKSVCTVILLFLICPFALANMAYMGPASGHVSGMNVGANVRVQYEKLTADLRKLPAGEALVFANYRLLCTGNGKVQFLFVASSEQPVKPEIIMDGKLLVSVPIIYPWEYSVSGTLSKAKIDSLSDLIGYDLQRGEGFHNQPIQHEIFMFEVLLTPGLHELKVGYTCIPTGFEQGSLRYTVFPYFLGNSTTKKQYDSIYVHVLLPDDVEYSTNFAVASKTQQGFVSANLAGFTASHITVALYKNVEPELAKIWSIFQTAAWMLLLVFTLLLLIMLRKRLIAAKRIWTIFVFYIVPGAAVASIAYYMGTMEYYSFFETKYGIWLEGSWGKGYLFLMVPFLFFMIAGLWTVLTFVYQYLIFNKKWDFLRFINQKK